MAGRALDARSLESRSQLLDAALAGADEANRRWEECRALVDQLRIENTALRNALQNAQGQLSALGAKVDGADEGVTGPGEGGAGVNGVEESAGAA